MTGGTPGREHRRGRERRASAIGNLLIVLSLTLVGGALSLTASPAVGVPVVRAAVVATAPARDPAVVATPTASPVTEATPSAVPLPVVATPSASPQVAGATPTSPPLLAEATATPGWVPELQAPPATLAATATPAVASATPVPHDPPTHIQIPAIGIDTPVVEVGFDTVTIQNQHLIQWQVADYAAGHHTLSADPGDGGNVVINGHDDWMGEVFRNLHLAQVGDQVILTTAAGTYRYAVTDVVYRKVVGVSLSDQLATAMYLAPMPQERVTLVTCWPYGVDNYRLIVIAKPVKP